MKLASRLRRVERRPDGTCRVCGRGPTADDLEWEELRGRIVVALSRFPEAKQAVLEAIRDEA